ncbi:hypothetical protein SASPL_104093 [Salvia splendens]|uniref:F-box domain-containing protein n=1 Tax=Salvia splendens TaxID=180675 RepID=A0A8X8YHC0_SALSN|nr:hypothetical protein SASPL_104093 [Salvia splendens]
MEKQKKAGLGFRVADKISELPDDIICIVLSFLSSRDATSTSVLSPRWLDLWKHVTNLNFFDPSNNHILVKSERENDSWNSETCKHVKMVNSALESHQALSLKQFRISFYVNKSAQSAIIKWLKFVWSRQVKRLDLNFWCDSREHAVVLGDSLGEMRPMKYLENLSVKMMKISGEDISLFLRNCPFLRKLNITTSFLTSEVHISGATLALEDLQIIGCSLRESINICAPNLTIVCVDARPGKLWFKNVPRLAVATFEIRSPRYTMHDFASALSCFTSQLHKLTLTLISHPNDDDDDVLIWQKFLGKGFPQLPNLKELIVNHSCLLPVTHVISACPRLQYFVFKFPYIDKEGTTDSRRFKRLEFKGSCSGNIIQSIRYISENGAFQQIKTHSMSVDNRKGICRQVELEFQVELRYKGITCGLVC